MSDAILLKKELVLTQTDADPVSGMATYEYVVEDGDHLHGSVIVQMRADQWAELDGPPQITVVIVPGDTLNG